VPPVRAFLFAKYDKIFTKGTWYLTVLSQKSGISGG
jgi:hypothetical protein